MKVLLLGKDGQVGWELQRTLAPLGEVVSHGRDTCDLADPDQIRETVRLAAPGLIVNAAAYNAVDRAESESTKAFAINGRAPGILAEEALKLGATVIHYSTDFVFDGAKEAPYTETDTPNPINTYGKSKLSGEQAIQSIGGTYLILRTGWVYSTRRDSFVTKVLAWSRKFPELHIVTDQVGSPTWARLLAEITAQIVTQGRIADQTGIFHLGGSGAASRHEWAKVILANDPHQDEQVTKTIFPATNVDFPTPAARPEYSVLDCRKFTATFGLRLPEWETALKMALETTE